MSTSLQGVINPNIPFWILFDLIESPYVHDHKQQIPTYMGFIWQLYNTIHIYYIYWYIRIRKRVGPSPWVRLLEPDPFVLKTAFFCFYPCIYILYSKHLTIKNSPDYFFYTINKYVAKNSQIQIKSSTIDPRIDLEIHGGLFARLWRCLRFGYRWFGLRCFLLENGLLDRRGALNQRKLVKIPSIPCTPLW